MGLLAFSEEFDAAVAAILPVPELVVASADRDDLLNRMKGRADTFRQDIRTWRAKARDWLPELRQILERASREGDGSEIRSFVNHRLPELWAVLDALSSEISQSARELSAEFDRLRAHGPKEIQGSVQSTSDAVAGVLAESRNAVNSVKEHIKAIEWEFDPDARGGPAFENAEDLIASLID